MANDFLQKIKEVLLNRKTTIKNEIKDVINKDPFIQEYQQEGFRNNDELGEEVTDLSQHDSLNAIKISLQQEEKAIDQSLEKIAEGQYGKCEKCGKEIEPERLKIFPTATMCAKCANN